MSPAVACRDRLETGGRDRPDVAGLGRCVQETSTSSRKSGSVVKLLESVQYIAAAAAYSRHCAECPDGVADVETAREHTRARDARVVLRVCDDQYKAVTEMARFAFCLAQPGRNEDDAVRSRGGAKAGFARGSRGARRHLWWTTPKSWAVHDASSSRRVFRDVANGFDTDSLDEACTDGAWRRSFRSCEPHGLTSPSKVGDPAVHLDGFVARGEGEFVPAVAVRAVREPGRAPRSALGAVPHAPGDPRVAQSRVSTIGSHGSRFRARRAALDFRRGESIPNDTENHDAYSAFVSKPYVLFDVKHGSHTANTRSGSLANPAEALFAACLYAALRRVKTGVRGRAADVRRRHALSRAARVRPEGVRAAFRWRRRRRAPWCAREHGRRVPGPGGGRDHIQHRAGIAVGERRDARRRRRRRHRFLAGVRRVNVALTRARSARCGSSGSATSCGTQRGLG